MSYKYLKEKEAVLLLQIYALIAQANISDAKEDAVYRSNRGDELPKELQFKQQRLKTIKAAKEALEARELANNPNQTVNDFNAKAQISFADKDARIMASSGQFDDSYNSQHALTANIKSLLDIKSVNALMINRKLNQLCWPSKTVQVKSPTK